MHTIACLFVHLTNIYNDSLSVCVCVCVCNAGKTKLRKIPSLLWFVADVITMYGQIRTAVMGVAMPGRGFTCILQGKGESGWGRDSTPFCPFYRYGVSLPACPLSCPPPQNKPRSTNYILINQYVLVKPLTCQ